jgi:hypothetical protein
LGEPASLGEEEGDVGDRLAARRPPVRVFVASTRTRRRAAACRLKSNSRIRGEGLVAILAFVCLTPRDVSHYQTCGLLEQSMGFIDMVANSDLDSRRKR